MFLGNTASETRGRRVAVVIVVAFHIVITQQEIEDLGVFRADEPAHFVRPDAQLLQLAELTVGLGFALKEEQDQLAGVAADALVQAHTRLRGSSGEGRTIARTGFSGSASAAVQVSCCCHLGFGGGSPRPEALLAEPRLPALLRGAGRQIVVFVIRRHRHRSTNLRHRRRSPPGPSAGYRAGSCRGGRCLPASAARMVAQICLQVACSS